MNGFMNVGLRQGCVMSPWLFNVYMDGVVREVNVRERVRQSMRKKKVESECR